MACAYVLPVCEGTVLDYVAVPRGGSCISSCCVVVLLSRTAELDGSMVNGKKSLVATSEHVMAWR
jgi:hypothetical protein